jgi:2-polyprenyl-3-methyl-5-hydroxy-6-metoxy-1,4-benzoquinol methylase
LNWQHREKNLRRTARLVSAERNKSSTVWVYEMSQGQTNDTLREWRESAKYWEKHAATIRKMFAPVTQALIEETRISEGDRVLDVAGGPGEPSLTIAEVVGLTGSVTCTDAVAKMVSAARDEAQRRGLENISFEQCLAESLPFEDNSFDAVVMPRSGGHDDRVAVGDFIPIGVDKDCAAPALKPKKLIILRVGL